MIADIYDFASVLSPIVGLRADTIVRAGSHLRCAKLLPPEGQPFTPQGVATLLVAVVGGRSPTEAVAAALAIGGVPFLSIEEMRVNAELAAAGRTLLASDPDLALELPSWLGTQGGFAATLGHFIERFSVEPSLADAVVSVAVVRGEFVAPEGQIIVRQARGDDGTFQEAKLTFALADADTSVANSRMVTRCYLPGSTLLGIANVFSGNESSPAGLVSAADASDGGM